MLRIHAFSFVTLSVALAVALASVACGAASGTPSGDDGAAADTAEAIAARIHCRSVDDCNAAFESGTWKVSPSRLDTCVQNHDFPYVCMACSGTANGAGRAGFCSFHPGF